jgi:TatD DNase family protein
MLFVDTHAHLYLPEFDTDRDLIIESALHRGVQKIFLPNIDSHSIKPMNELSDRYPDICFPMMGLHPTSVKSNFHDELLIVKKKLESKQYYAIGETGIDLYWDKQYLQQQCIVFEEEIKLALQYGLPIVIHTRNSFNEIMEILEGYRNSGLSGIFHAFTGSIENANRVINLGFKIGIGGIVTFKNSGLEKVVQNIATESIVLETDSPYLTPVPKRFKRNESSYIYYIADAVANFKNITLEKVADITTTNALNVFKVIN